MFETLQMSNRQAMLLTGHVRDCIVSPELLFANHFSQVLDNKLSRAKSLFGADAPALALCAESLQTLHPFMSLDVLVVTLLHTGTSARRALSEAHPGEERHKITSLISERQYQRVCNKHLCLFTYSGSHPDSPFHSGSQGVDNCM